MNNILLILFFQVVLESLPISSSGHVFLIVKNLFLSISKDFLKFFDHLIHGPTIFIIILFFWKEWYPLLKKLIYVSPGKDSYKKLVGLFCKIVGYVLLADFITGLFYLAFRVLLEKNALLTSNFCMLVGFIVTAVGLFSLKWLKDVSYKTLNIRKVFLLGVVQGVALLPGISRFASTYIVARWLRVSPRRALQFSFLIDLPLIVLAFFGGLTKMLVYPERFMEVILVFCSPVSWIVVMIATVLGYYALRLSVFLCYERKFWWFGIYMIFPILFLLYNILQ